MPFRDRGWEDFQRDCSFFPAYTDYIFGVDDRPEVAEQPGLHPQIFDPQPRPVQRLLGLPSQVRFPTAYDPVRDATQTRPCDTRLPPPASLLRRESTTESMMPTPCPAPRLLPTTGAPMPLLRPNDLVTDPAYASVPQPERAATNLHITQAWAIMESNAVPAQKTKAMGYIKSMSRVAALKRQEHQAREAARLEAEKQAEQGQESCNASWLTTPESEGHMEAEQQYYASPPNKELLSSEAQQAEATSEHETVQHEYAIHDISQLPAYMQSRLPQLWACTEIVILQGPPTDPGRVAYYQQAQQYLLGFLQSVPSEGRRYVRFVMDGMIKLRKQGCDPLAVLQTMPRVEDLPSMESSVAT